MPTIKISSKVDPAAWNDLRAFAGETNRSISGVLNEAITEYVQRRRVRPLVLDALEKSVAKNRRLGELLAR
jgi:predicted transcriptional regulator